MSEASAFRLYAEEAIRGSSTAANEAEKQALEELACIWAQAALLSDRVVRRNPWATPDFGEAIPLSRAGHA